MIVTASKLRQNIYKFLDRILETGEPLEVKWKGAILKIIPAVKRSKIDRLKHRHVMRDDPHSFVHIDWADEWRGWSTSKP